MLPIGTKPAEPFGPQTSEGLASAGPRLMLLASVKLAVGSSSINWSWWALVMVVEYSLSSIGRVAPAAPPALLRLPSTSTITQQGPPVAQDGPPGVAPKFQPEKFDALPNRAVVRPVPAALVDWPLVCVSQ